MNRTPGPGLSQFVPADEVAARLRRESTNPVYRGHAATGMLGVVKRRSRSPHLLGAIRINKRLPVATLPKYDTGCRNSLLDCKVSVSGRRLWLEGAGRKLTVCATADQESGDLANWSRGYTAPLDVTIQMWKGVS